MSSLTILGSAREDRLLLRTGARAGDVLLATGSFGGSLPSGRHLTFEPRLAEGRWLAEQGCRCGIDVSDGLLKDASRLAAASGLTIELDLESVPRACVADEKVGLDQALLDGEDYELLASIAADRVGDLLEAWPFQAKLTAIGRCLAGGAGVVDPAGHDLLPKLSRGYRHF